MRDESLSSVCSGLSLDICLASVGFFHLVSKLLYRKKNDNNCTAYRQQSHSVRTFHGLPGGLEVTEYHSDEPKVDLSLYAVPRLRSNSLSP